MDKNYGKMFQQKALLLERLNGEAKRDYYEDLFTSSFIQALIFRRKEENLNQSEIGQLMGVKQSYISKIENLEKVPTLGTIARYCYALNFRTDEIKILFDDLSNAKETFLNLSWKYFDSNKYWNDNQTKHFMDKKPCELVLN